MATIFYSMAGEGRGHASRVRAISDALRLRGHRLRLFAPAQAYDFLEPLYRDSEVRITRIPGLVFDYTAGGQVDYRRTGMRALRYWLRRPQWSKTIQEAFQQEQPDLVISDFEPELPRQANRIGVPWLSLDHQNFLRTYDLSRLPLWLRMHSGYMAAIVAAYGNRARRRIVSSFYFPPLRAGIRNVTQIGVIFRDAIRHAVPGDAGHVTVYLRRGIPENVRRALLACGRPVHIFSPGEPRQQENLHYHPIQPDQFVENLTHCSVLVTTAGNQLLGEALYLGKPVLAMPEKGNYEQEINGFFLNECGGGRSLPMQDVDSELLREFLANTDGYRLSESHRQRLDGLPTALDTVLESLQAKGEIRNATLA